MKRPFDAAPVVKVEEVKKMRRRCFIILMMYSGRNYYGMQRLKDFPSIEEELIKALLKSNLITDFNYLNLPSIRFQRCSKTDRGVSALSQVVSAQLNEEVDNPAKIINSNLPSDIRVLDVFRGTKSFNSKTLCENREYMYFMPSFALLYKQNMTQEELFKSRISAEDITKFNRILSNYVGTRFYFNFTSGRTSNDQSCQRYMRKVECQAPFLNGEIEFLCIIVNGQSFMLHQIRKMIGLALAVMAGHTEETIYQNAFSSLRIDVPKAPGLGLILNQVFFTNYNERHCSNNEHKAIQFENYTEERESFKSQQILPYILEREQKERVMMNWLENLSQHTFDVKDKRPDIVKIEPEIVA